MDVPCAAAGAECPGSGRSVSRVAIVAGLRRTGGHGALQLQVVDPFIRIAICEVDVATEAADGSGIEAEGEGNGLARL